MRVGLRVENCLAAGDTLEKLEFPQHVHIAKNSRNGLIHYM